MDKPLVSIIIPHYQTPLLARLCLRSIRYYTAGVPYEVIVVDNGSRDGESLAYLRGVEWIRLIERTDGVNPVPVQAHKEALDIGIAAAAGRYVLSYHTDTIAIRDGWLAWLVAKLEASERTAAVGTHKLEIKSPWSRGLRRMGELLLPWAHRRDEPYIRSHCAMYRKDVLEKLGLRFMEEAPTTTGLRIHNELLRRGYEVRLLDVAETLKRVVHLNHGTMVLLPEFHARPRTVRRGMRRINAFLHRPEVIAILNDESLDRAR